jgi:hypothetical protein
VAKWLIELERQRLKRSNALRFEIPEIDVANRNTGGIA